MLTQRKPDTDAEAEQAVGGYVFSLQRRLRILTVAPSVARSHADLYASAQLEPVIAMLTQKVLLHSVHDGAAESRALLQVRLCMNMCLVKVATSVWPEYHASWQQLHART